MEPEQHTTDAAEETTHPLTHGYENDLAKAMDATDPATVQALFADARERETVAAEIITEHSERKWYSVTGLLLVLLTLGVIGYGIYYYMHLTVPVAPAVSVGVFQNTDNIVASNTTIAQVLATYSTADKVPVGKPVLINLVTDGQTNTLLSNSELYSFIGAEVPEPLQSVITVARLGMVDTGTQFVPFIIASVPDTEKGSKEFTIAEPNLLQMFYQALNIDISTYQNTPQTFQSSYFYNIPVRTLTVTDPATAQQTMIFLYGYISNNTVVITTQPDALKAVYDSVINQH